MLKNHRPGSSGFTLVEISIVLLIVSLLVGGIVVGMNLMRSAEVKNIPQEIADLRQSVTTFRDRYENLPGDMYNATKFWGTQNAVTALCISGKSTGPATCNGDGNGLITTFGTAATYYETHRFWQHLNNAGLQPGHFDGDRPVTTTGFTCRALNHCGRSKYKNGIFFVGTVGINNQYFRTMSVVQDLYVGDKGHAILLFGNAASVGGVAATSDAGGPSVGAPLIPVSDAQQLDAKVDDGKPGSGFVQTFQPVGGLSYLANSCAASATAYNIGSGDAKCALLFINAF